MLTKKRFTPHFRARQGFTLVELMIVIGIIALLITISVTVYANFIATSREQATAATINKINRIIQQRKDAFERLPLKDAAAKLAAVNASYFGANQKPLAEIILRKQRFQQAFPQRVQDRSLFNGVDYSPIQNSQFESSALLYLAITQGETFGAPSVDDDAFSSNELQTTTVGALSVTFFVDAWGQPLRFYRWPTTLISAVGTQPNDVKALISSIPTASLTRDPDDPLDRISQMSATSLNWFQTNFHPARTFHTPLIVSSGPDRQLGMLEPNDSSSPPTSRLGQLGSSSAIIDNITNLNQRIKGN